MRNLPLMMVLLSGCAALTGKPEGDWLLTIDQTASMCDGQADTDLDEPFQATGTTMQLQDGTFVFMVGGATLTGEATREGFTLTSVDKATYSDPTCTSYEESTIVSFKGSFGEDLAMGGRLEVKTGETATDCYGQNTSSSCTTAYNIQGILLESTRQDHLNASGDAGYF